MVITRFHGIERLEAQVEFLTPTFLGGANQNAELRSAPFKNLLRQWWRISQSALNSASLRLKETALFGSVDNENSGASRVRIGLTPNGLQFLETPFQFGTSIHSEVQGGRAVQNCLYLGYGPVTYDNGLRFRKYIAPGGRATLTIDAPAGDMALVKRILDLAHAFGTIGSRSRNGYGSIAISYPEQEMPRYGDLGARTLEDFYTGTDTREYPHGFGRDGNKSLCWQTTAAYPAWQDAMQALASLYMGTRLAVPLAARGVDERHIMGYPVTHHEVYPWGGQQGRMPSQLRLKVIKLQDGRFRGRIVHIPHKIPKPWPIALPTELETWRKIHAHLDKQKAAVVRIPAGGAL
jgi:CRISPR-associated protein Cmr1